MFLLNIFLPLIGFLTVCFLGAYLGKKGSIFITVSISGITAILSIISFYSIGLLNTDYYLHLGTWIQVDMFNTEWGFQFDTLTAVMLCVVTIISFIVPFYSSSYMVQDPHISRFMSYLCLFTFFMLILICSDNFIVLFLGWEGVGLSSYLLITFWFTRLSANKAAIKAMVVNRIGDVGVILGVLGIFDSNDSINFDTVFIQSSDFKTLFINLYIYEINALTFSCFFLFVGSIGKSAQLGLHIWLPVAMEGPTPVSALIHAATMVTAGVFLIIRCSPLFEYSITVLTCIALVGSLTAFFGASIGLVQNDIKKVIAYSTTSQLGYMTLACGFSNYSASLFHLVNHAFFKALLFLSAGALIHGFKNVQDMRLMGSFLIKMPYTAILFIIGSLALIGFPFFSGAYSKDLIIETAYIQNTFLSTTIYILSLLAAICTVLYSIRLFYLAYICAPKRLVTKKKKLSGYIFHLSKNFSLKPIAFLIEFNTNLLYSSTCNISYFLKDKYQIRGKTGALYIPKIYLNYLLQIAKYCLKIKRVTKLPKKLVFSIIKLNKFSNINPREIITLHDSDYITILPLTFLAICSIFSGGLLQDWFIGSRLDFFKHSIFIFPENIELNLIFSIPSNIKIIPTLLIVFFIILGTIFYILNGVPYLLICTKLQHNFFLHIKLFTKVKNSIELIYNKIYFFLTNAWYFDLIYDKIIVYYIVKKSNSIFTSIDEGFLELLGASGIIKVFLFKLKHLRKFFTGNICDYIIFMVSSFILLIQIL